MINLMLALATDAIRMKDSRGRLPLYLAAEYNNVDAIELHFPLIF